MPFFKRRNTRYNFFDLLIQHTQATRDTIDALCTYCENPTYLNSDLVKNAESHADEIRHQLVDEINDSFVTPIDREDLFRLSNTIDELADYAWTTVKELRIYEIKPDAALLQLAKMLRDMADILLLSVSNLENNRELASAEAVRAKKMENQINVAFHESIVALFASDDIKKILKYREIYNHMNHAADKGDLAADTLLHITVKI